MYLNLYSIKRGSYEMDINKLKTFLLVSQFGSFRGAAERLYLSPRAVSKQMNQIENELGVKLFKRSKNQTSLTTEGKAFTVTAQDIVNTYNNALTKIRTNKLQNTEKMTAGISSPTQSTICQTVLTKFLEDNPKVQIDIEQESGKRLISLVNAGALDFCITPFYKTKDSDNHLPGLSKIDLFVGELDVGLSKMNPLSKKNSINLKELSNLNVLYYTPFGSNFLKKTFLTKFAGLINSNRIHPVSTLEQRDLMVAANKGFGFYPSILKDEEELENPLINFLPINNDCNKYYSSSLWYNKKNKNSALKKLIAEFKK